jgi:hypothetical protein
MSNKAVALVCASFQLTPSKCQIVLSSASTKMSLGEVPQIAPRGAVVGGAKADQRLPSKCQIAPS